MKKTVINMAMKCLRDVKKNELLEYLLRDPESGSEIVVSEGEVVLEDNIAIGNKIEDLEENRCKGL